MAEPPDGTPKGKVIILGGGLGGLTAAFELSKPGWESRFESITVYQQGWRLGGKGASGRAHDKNDRIEEHGLHIWLGFYENSFRMMRECYREIGDGAPFRTAEDAFTRASIFVVEEKRPEGWIPWEANFPETPDFPGRGDRVPTLWELVQKALVLGREFLVSAARTEPSGTEPSGTESSGTEAGGVFLRPARKDVASSGSRENTAQWEPGGTTRSAPVPGSATLEGLKSRMRALSQLPGDAALVAALALSATLHHDVDQHSPADHDLLIKWIDHAVDWARKVVRPLVEDSDARRRDWYLADITLACVRGVLNHGLLTHPDQLDAIDQYDFSLWLEMNGADPESIQCALIRTVVYDLQFAYQDGDPDTPACSAATALRGLLRLFLTYRGAIAWKMRGGMGDVVFAPLYRSLAARGVEFEFFHRVEKLHLSGQKVQSVAMTVQAQVKDGAKYDPLVNVNGLWCWPNQPRGELLASDPGPDCESYYWSPADPVPAPLNVGPDDTVVLAIPVGAHQELCSELIADDPRWEDMVANLGTIWTQGFQVWLNASPAEIGWPWGSGTLGGYLEPFDTVADMSHLIERESWDPGTVRSIAYFCSAMRTPKGQPSDSGQSEAVRAATEQVRKDAIEFLRRRIGPLWPGASRRYPDDFRWDLLVDPEEGSGETRFGAQFWRANSDPSERYVLPLPGTTRYRLPPGDSGYENLKLAGDWTKCVINSGCVEAAVISGMLAAQAITGFPLNDEIVGYEAF